MSRSVDSSLKVDDPSRFSVAFSRLNFSQMDEDRTSVIKETDLSEKKPVVEAEQPIPETHFIEAKEQMVEDM